MSIKENFYNKEEDNNSTTSVSDRSDIILLKENNLSSENHTGNNNYSYKSKEDIDEILNQFQLPIPYTLILKFKTKKKSKRGQIPKNPEKRDRTHSKLDFDNLHRKIQVHFFSFIVNISNDAIATEFGYNKYIFKHISHNIKKIVNYNFCNNLKKSTIKDILSLKISSKYKNCDSDFNKNLLLVLNKDCNSEWLNKFWKMNFIEIFEKYHSKGEQIKEFLFENKTIILSKSTKSFFDLLNRKGNILIKDKLIKTASRVYLNGYNEPIKSNSFKTKKFK